MRILICNNSFPGQFEALAECLVREHELLFASSYARRDFSMNGTRFLNLRKSHARSPKEQDRLILPWLRAVAFGREAYIAFTELKKNGYEPDIILFSAGCAESLFLREIFPFSFRVAYLGNFAPEISLQPEEQKSFNLLIQGVSLLRADAVFAFPGVIPFLPLYLRKSIGSIPVAVNTNFFNPDQKQFINGGVDFSQIKELVNIYLATQDLKNEKIRADLSLLFPWLLKRQNCHILLSYEKSESTQMLDTVLADFKHDTRFHTCGILNRKDYQGMLACSTCRIFPGLIPSMEDLLETMSSGAILIAIAECQ